MVNLKEGLKYLNKYVLVDIYDPITILLEDLRAVMSNREPLAKCDYLYSNQFKVNKI